MKLLTQISRVQICGETRFRESRTLTPRKDEAYPQQIFSYKTTDGTSDTVNKEKCCYLGTNQSFISVTIETRAGMPRA